MPKSYLRTSEAADYLGLAKSTLERMRIRGNGPNFRVLGAKVVIYAVTDLDDFAGRDVRTSTAQDNIGKENTPAPPLSCHLLGANQ